VSDRSKRIKYSQRHTWLCLSLFLSHSTSCARTIPILFSKALSYSCTFSQQHITQDVSRQTSPPQPTKHTYAVTQLRTPWPCRIITSITSLARPIFNKSLAFDSGTVPLNDPNTSCGYVFRLQYSSHHDHTESVLAQVQVKVWADHDMTMVSRQHMVYTFTSFRIKVKKRWTINRLLIFLTKFPEIPLTSGEDIHYE
jgi:hypothetical protein